jgi:MFS family permease
MVFGLVLMVGCSFSSAITNEYSWFIVSRVGQGIGSALYMTAATTWVALISGKEHRGRILALYSGIIFAAVAFGPTIGGYTAARFGLNSPFFVYGGLCLLGLVATLPLKEIAEPHGRTQSNINLRDVAGIFMNKSFLLVSLAVIAYFFMNAGVRSSLIPLYASLNIGLTEDTIGLVLTVGAVVSSLCIFPFGWLSDRIGRKKLVMVCLSVSAIAIALVPLQKELSGLLAMMVFYGFATSMQGAGAAWPADVAPKDKLGAAMGAYRVSGDIGLVVGPLTMTYVTDLTGTSTVSFIPFLIPALLAIIVIPLLTMARDPVAETRSRTQHPHPT